MANDQRIHHPWSKDLESFLQRNSGMEAVVEPEKLEYYRYDLNVDLPPLLRDMLLKSIPDLVLKPTTEEHIREIFAFARGHRIPLTVRGAGTWGYGGAVPTSGGILVDLGLMDTIEVNPEALEVTVGPGARFMEIEDKLEGYGLSLLAMASGKGGSLIGWMATGGMGLGTFHHGPIRDQIASLRAITPAGESLHLRPEDPEMAHFLGTEGQMGIIAKATVRVGKRPSRSFPFVISFDKLESAYCFAKTLAKHPSVKPDEVVVYHSEFVQTIKAESDGKMTMGDGDAVMVAFSREEGALKFRACLDEQGISPCDEESANQLWEKRFLPMSIKHLGPSLLASELVLPIDRVAPYYEKVREWGKRLGITFYPTAHLVNGEQVLFLAMLATDSRKTLFYADLMLIPMMLRMAIQQYHGKPYGVGTWNTPFLRDLYPKKELGDLVRFKKKVDPTGILNPGKFFGASGRLGALQKALFQSNVFDLGLAATQWLLFKFISALPVEALRRSVPVVPEGMEEITNDVLACAQCGSCVARCPVYRATHDETLTAKGKLLTIKKALEKKQLELSKVLPLYFCLRCGRCDDECQVHLDHRSLFEKVEKYLGASAGFPLEEVKRFIQEVEGSPEFQKFLDVVRTGFDQRIHEQRNTFPRYRVTIDPAHCLHCGTCVDACMYSVRKRDEADPRRVVVCDEALCRGCGACLERCPQVAKGLAATSVELHPDCLNLDDPYWNFNVVTPIDLEATTGKIPVSGTGQGDRHRGLGNDGVRFGHFHIVGPAQNLLYESTEDAIGIALGQRPKYLTFNGEKIATPAPRLVPFRTPILVDVLPMEGGEELLAPLLDAAAKTGTRVTLRLEDIERYGAMIKSRKEAFIPRFTRHEVERLFEGEALPEALRDRLPDLVEIELDDGLLSRMDGVGKLFPEPTVLCAVIRIEKGDVDSELQPAPRFRKKLEVLISSPFDILCLSSDYDPRKGYYPTTDAVPALHRFLVDLKIRHRFSILASGGIRSAADAQKTVQRGANGIKIDWPVLLTADPQARQKFLRGEKIRVLHDPSSLAKRITNLIRVWNIQIIEVLGASGFKDIKKTVGEENRLLIFDDLEERVYDILQSPRRLQRNLEKNRKRIEREFDLAGFGWRYGQLRDMIKPAQAPHRFYDLNLKSSCYRIFDRDNVWPASLIASVGRMAAGDRKTLLLNHTEERGNLGDGFDAIQIRFPNDPDEISEERLDEVSTALRLSPALQIKTPFMGAGMSVGSIGPGTWRARVLAARSLGTQLDTGEGGYPTIFILDAMWNPLDFTDEQVAFLGRFMEERKLVTVEKLAGRLRSELGQSPETEEILNVLKRYPGSMAIQFVPIVTTQDEPYISTELKTGLFGVTKETIRRARRVVIAYSQGAKQGVGGHLLGRKVFGLVSRLRGVPEGVSLISPFPFHNCYSIEDVKAFIDAVRMMNRRTAISIKVSPSPDIEFIVSGLARIAKDNQMMIEVWLDGPRGGTGAAPDIIKGQMGMHMEYAIPICHEKLIDDGLRDHVVFMGSGGFRTWGDVVKGVAMGLDGVILGTADLVAIGCVRDRNCESGCRSGISTLNPKMQLLRDVELNTRQIINFQATLQAQVTRAIAALGLKDIRELRGRYDCIEWSLLEERVENRRSRREETRANVPYRMGEASENGAIRPASQEPMPVPSDCGVAAIVSNHAIPSHVMDLMLDRMANRGMDGVGIWKGGCYPDRMDHYALHILVKGMFQDEVEERHLAADLNLYPSMIQPRARQEVLEYRRQVMKEIVERYFKGLELTGFDGDVEKCRISYRRDKQGQEQDFRSFGERDPGDVFRFFVRVRRGELNRFIENDLLKDRIWPSRQIRHSGVTPENYREDTEFLREAEDEYIYRLSRQITRENYVECEKKKAAVFSCGKNSGCWKTDGRDIPWETPQAPVNLIHRRLATGSVVDQMNSHPFAELHTALTHNGETTNYRTMLNRIRQFNLTPLAQTDTAVASLKLHLLSQYLRYPFEALVESFSPTTGWKLTQLPPETRERFERVQEVELESAPDGPYQYLCGRIDPYHRVIERLDIIDPSLLRPNVAMLYDDGTNFVSIICSEKQGADAGMQELYRLGMVRSTVPGLTFTVGTGMVSRVYYDDRGRITRYEVLDKSGQPVKIPYGAFSGSEPAHPASAATGFEKQSDLTLLFRDRMPSWSFRDLQKALKEVADHYSSKEAIEKLTRIYDYLPGWDTGKKDRGLISHIVAGEINTTLDQVGAPGKEKNGMVRMTIGDAGKLERPEDKEKVLVVDARGFRPEGINPLDVLSCFLDRAHQIGWRKFIVYRVQGQRGIAMGIGSGSTFDTVVDVFGSPGEYTGAFNMGARVRVHTHAQNFTGMVMHSGTLEIHGDAGKVTGYSAKGGEFNILGNVVDRGWVCAVSDPRGQGLTANVVGTAFEHLCQAMMGGSVIMLGLYRTDDGLLHRLPSPYSGAKILAGASAGEVMFYDPDKRLEEAQYKGCAQRSIDDEKWKEIVSRLLHLENLFGLGIEKENSHLTIGLDGKPQEMGPEDFRWIRPKGELEGYH